MGLVNREAPHEPDEKPTELGRHIWTTCRHEHPGEWRVVFETEKRERAVHIEGCLIGRGAGRIAPIIDLTGWDARMVEIANDNGGAPLYEIRVKYTPGRHTEADKRAESVMEKLRQGQELPETERVKPLQEQLSDRR